MLVKASLLVFASLASLANVGASPLNAPMRRDGSTGSTGAVSNIPEAEARNITSSILSLYQQNGNINTADPPVLDRLFASLAPSNNQVGTMSEYDLQRYATYAGAAYKVKTTAWTCHLNCQVPSTNGTVVQMQWTKTAPDSLGYIATNDNTKEIIVAYRGSITIGDWIHDFTFAQLPSPLSVPGSLMHTGFLVAYGAAKDDVKATVSKLLQQYPDYKLVITGHSLGGAEAAVAATDFAANNPSWKSRMMLVTFGQPRVGNIIHSNWLAKQNFPIFRVVNEGDLVPHASFTWMNYYHEPQEVWYDLNGKTHFCGSTGENPSCSDSLLPIQWSVLQHNEYPGLYFEYNVY
ncbi:alpha/beta-hydrolase [Martensiomyces pterosporus]|nr:alpha/beta-hydrolase [Martensiomyces pterosporus]